MKNIIFYYHIIISFHNNFNLFTTSSQYLICDIDFTLLLSNPHNLYYFKTNFNIKIVKKFNSLVHLLRDYLYDIH